MIGGVLALLVKGLKLAGDSGLHLVARQAASVIIIHIRLQRIRHFDEDMLHPCPLHGHKSGVARQKIDLVVTAMVSIAQHDKLVGAQRLVEAAWFAAACGNGGGGRAHRLQRRRLRRRGRRHAAHGHADRQPFPRPQARSAGPRPGLRRALALAPVSCGPCPRKWSRSSGSDCISKAAPTACSPFNALEHRPLRHRLQHKASTGRCKPLSRMPATGRIHAMVLHLYMPGLLFRPYKAGWIDAV